MRCTMAYYPEIYDVYVIVARGGTAPWMRSRWPNVAKALDPIVTLGDKPIGVRTFQRGRGDRGDPRFGKLGWDEKSHARWPLQSGSPIEFGDMEVWAPSWTRCVSPARAPTVFFTMCNPAVSDPRPRVSSILLLAVATRLGRRAVVVGRKAAKDVADAVSTIARRHRRQPCGRLIGAGLIADFIPFMLLNRTPFKPDWEQSRAPIDSLFATGWKKF
jgi:hypothetical protein